MPKKKKEVKRSWLFYNSELVSKWTNWILFLALYAIYILVFFVVPYPAAKQTTESLQYLPLNIELGTIGYEMSEDETVVVNKVDIQTLDEYIEYSSEVIGTHFLIVSSGYGMTNFDYYYAEPGNVILRHYGYSEESDLYFKMFAIGYFEVDSYYLEGDKLVVNRKFEESEAAIGFLMVGIPWIVGGVLWLLYVSERVGYLVRKLADR